ncbi:protein FAM110A-like isoform X1 [Haemaphysalis longicornis]
MCATTTSFEITEIEIRTRGQPLGCGGRAAAACVPWSVMAASVQHACCPAPLQQPRTRRLSAQAELGVSAQPPRPARPHSHGAASSSSPTVPEQQTPGEQRRSAVERLEESKAQYVKSERVLDSRQGLRSRRSEGGAPFEPPLLARSPSAYELVERLRASPPAALLARAPSLKLRRAPSPPMRARALSETQARRLLRPARTDQDVQHQLRRLIAGDAPPSLGQPPGLAVVHKSLPDLSPSRIRRASTELRSGDPGDHLPSYRDRCRKPRPASETVGRSLSFRPLDLPSRNYGLTSQAASRRPVLRSKSDVTHRSQPDLGGGSRADGQQPPRSLSDRFFDTLGLDASTWHSVLSPSSSSGSSSSRYFNSVSSVDSAGHSCSLAGSDDDTSSLGGRAGGAGLRNRDLVDHGPTETSIVEKNARVIKWLFNCRRAAVGS